MKVKDFHKEEQTYNNWKKKGMKINSIQRDKQIILEFLQDSEKGKNINGSVKGGRSFSRLNTLRTRIPQLSRFFYDIYKKGILQLSRDEVTEFFHEMERGDIVSKKGKPYKSWKDFIKDYKTFWHWYMKREKRLYQDSNGKDGQILFDITEDLQNTAASKTSTFVYLTMEQIQMMIDNTSQKYKTLILFLVDSGARPPKEAYNTRVSDLYEDKKSGKLLLNIRDNVAKTFGRKIKLMLSSDVVRKWIKVNNFKDNDLLFDFSTQKVNYYLKRLAVRLFGTGVTQGGNSYDKITAYDFRHASACYWLPRYNKQTTLMYRMGWVKADKIQYYTNFLGIKDDITEDDLITQETSSELQKELEKEKQKRQILQEGMEQMEKKVEAMTTLLTAWADNWKLEGKDVNPSELIDKIGVNF